MVILYFPGKKKTQKSTVLQTVQARAHLITILGEKKDQTISRNVTG